jgi:hypothetical protein
MDVYILGGQNDKFSSNYYTMKLINNSQSSQPVYSANKNELIETDKITFHFLEENIFQSGQYIANLLAISIKYIILILS